MTVTITPAAQPPATFEGVSLTALFDVLDEMTTDLGGTYVALSTEASEVGDEERAAFWLEQDARLGRWVMTVDPSSREAILAAIDQVRTSRQVLAYATTPLGHVA